MATKKAPWKRPTPERARHTKLTSAQKSAAKERAARGGRRYPNLVDNMAIAGGTTGGKKETSKPKKRASKKKGASKRKAASKRAGSAR